MDGLLVFL